MLLFRDEKRETREEPKRECVELSQQLIDRRVDALERKYGGHVARESATKIQRAFRTYRLQKRFQSIALEALKTKDSQMARHHSLHQIQDNQSTRSDDTNGHLVSEQFTASVAQQHECERKRRYRVGLNLLNKKPEKGIAFLVRHGFLESHSCVERQAQSVARFLLTRKGVSKAVVGDYLSNNDQFSQKVLKYFSRELDFSSLPVDQALRKFQTYFRFPGETLIG